MNNSNISFDFNSNNSFVDYPLNQSFNYNFNIYNYKSIILSRIKKCNDWINQGKYSFYNSYNGGLAAEINIIKNEISKCNILIYNYKQKNDLNKLEIAQKLKDDIEQTISRYNKLNCNKDEPAPKFNSAFDEYYNRLNNSDIRPTIKGKESNYYDQRQIFKK